MEERVYIANIQKCCVHDGPGIRTVVFLKGCPLRCKWCQNPENLMHAPAVMVDQDKCTGCGKCVRACSRGAIGAAQAEEADRRSCNGCGTCVENCLTGARTLCGKAMTPEELFREVMKDEVFFRSTGGGITFSGGEPVLYPEYVSAVLKLFQAAGIHTAVETSGYCKAETIERLRPHVDLFLYDMKMFTPELHKTWTACSNERIKANLEYLLRSGQEVIVRIPLIPDVNDGTEFVRMMEYLKLLGGPEQIHIMPFHQIGSSKYLLSGVEYEMEAVAECTAENAEACAEIARDYGFQVNIGGWEA